MAGSLRAFGGAPLNGSKWVRVLYMDESGIGNIKSDPFLVVAGVVIHADTQWGMLANRLDQMLSNAVPPGAPKPRFLHAKDVFHGSGEFPRDVWDQPRRNALLRNIGSLVHEHNIPIVWIGIDRKKFARENSSVPAAELLETIYLTATVGCFMQTELFMRQDHMSAEVCSIVMEQNQELQKRIPEMVAFMRDPSKEATDALPGWERIMPLTKLIDAPSCQAKTASSILQIADYCAFALKRLLQGSAGAKRLTAVFSPQLLSYEPLKAGLKHHWNPVHMPSMWPFPVVYDDRKGFVRADGLADERQEHAQTAAGE